MTSQSTSGVWEQFAQQLRYFIRSKVAGDHDVEDILQDVFIKVHQNLNKLKEVSKIERWLYRITRNAIADFYRREKPKYPVSEINTAHSMTEVFDVEKDRNFMSLVYTLENVSPHFKKMKLENDGKLDYDEAKRFFSTICPFLEKIPEKYAEAVFLTDYFGLSQVELAARLNISVSGAKSRVQRGREKLKALFFECCDFHFDSRGRVMHYTRKKDCTNNCG